VSEGEEREGVGVGGDGRSRKRGEKEGKGKVVKRGGGKEREVREKFRAGRKRRGGEGDLRRGGVIRGDWEGGERAEGRGGEGREV